jgi:hypothetical protein
MEIYLHTHTTLCAVSKRKRRRRNIYVVYNIIGRLGRLCFYFYWEKRAARPTPNIALPTFRPQTYRVLNGFFFVSSIFVSFSFSWGKFRNGRPMCILICGFGGVCVFFSYFSNEVWLIFLSFGRSLQYDEVSPPLSLRTCVHGRVPFFISIKKIQQCVSFVL